MSTWARLRRGLILCLVIIVPYTIIPSSVYSSTHTDVLGLQHRIHDLSENLGAIVKTRVEHLNEVCQGLNSSEIPDPKTILYSRNIDTAYCPVAETDSSLLKYSFLQIEGKKLKAASLYQLSENWGLHIDAQQLNLPQAKLRNPESLHDARSRFLMVSRSPWTRLESYYRTNIKTLTPLCSKHKPERPGTPLAFDTFLQCLIASHKASNDTTYLESHLKPVWMTCSICRVPYNIIVEHDTMIVELSALYQPVAVKNGRRFIDFITAHIQHITQFKSESLYKITAGLSRDTIYQIQTMYKLDFLAFNYPIISVH